MSACGHDWQVRAFTGWEEEVVVKAGVTLKPQRGIPVSVRESVWVCILRLSRAYCLLPRDGGKLEGRKGCMESCAVT